MTHRIEKAGFEDFSQLAELFAQDGPSGQGPPTTETIVGGLWRGAVYKATVNGRIAGAVILGEEDDDVVDRPWRNDVRVLEIRHFIVGSEFAGLAVGRRLLEFVESKAAEQGVEQVNACIANGNAVAMWLLRRFGYVKAGSNDPSADRESGFYEKKIVPAIQGEQVCV